MKKYFWLLVFTLSLQLQAEVVQKDQGDLEQLIKSLESSCENEEETALLQLKIEQEITKERLNEAQLKISQLESNLKEQEQAWQQFEAGRKDQEQGWSKINQLEKQMELNLQNSQKEQVNLLRQMEAFEVSLQEKERRQFKDAESKIAQLEKQFSGTDNIEQECPPKKNVKCFDLPQSHKGWVVGVSFLYWKVDIACNDYALYQKKNLSEITNTGVPAPNGMLGSLKNQHFEWNPGGRVELGYCFAKDLWNLLADYTFYYTKGSHHLSAPNDVLDPSVVPIVNPTFLSGITVVKAIKNSNDFHYNVIDLVLAKAIPIGKKIWMRFIGGATAAFISEDMHARVLAIDESTATHHWQWDYKGGGIKLGFDSHWNPCGGFNILLGLSGSSLYGKYINQSHAFAVYSPTTPDVPPSKVLADMRSDMDRTIFAVQTLGGIAWNRPCRKMNFEIFLQYELNTWFDLNQRYMSIRNNQSNFDKHRSVDVSNVNLQGITGGLRFTF